jgi:molybdenum cofactor cytidylyltransferase
VCDQPFLDIGTIHRLIEGYEMKKKHIVASTYADTVGVPALFDRSLFEIMLQLDDHAGAKKLIEHHPELLCTIEFPDGAVDIDTPSDYENYLRSRRL